MSSFLDPFGIFESIGLFSNPYGDAKNALSDTDGKTYKAIEEQALKYYEPYMQAGATALPTVMDEYAMLINDPGSFWASLGSGFTESPGYQYQYNEAMNASNQAAAAGGMAGTQSHQQYSSAVASDLAAQGYTNYMDDMMMLYKMGLVGMEDLNKMGYDANVAMATSMGNLSTSMAKMAYGAAAMKNRATMAAMAALAEAIPDSIF